MQGVQEAARRHNYQDGMDIFDEINKHYLDQQQLQNPEELERNTGNNFVDKLIDAELTLYRQEVPVAMKDNLGHYNIPLLVVLEWDKV